MLALQEKEKHTLAAAAHPELPGPGGRDAGPGCERPRSTTAGPWPAAGERPGLPGHALHHPVAAGQRRRSRRASRRRPRPCWNRRSPLVEAARLRTYGDAQQRAAFFAQFAPAFEQLVDWSVRDGDVEEALTHGRPGPQPHPARPAAAGRRRSASTPAGAHGKSCCQQEEELRAADRRHAGRAQLLALEATTEEAGQEAAGRASTQAQQEYAEVWREILNASPVYRNLAGRPAGQVAGHAPRAGALARKTLLLVYHLGQEHSYLLLLGDKTRPTKSFPLTVSRRVPSSLAALRRPASADSSHGRPGHVSSRPAPQPPAGPPARWPSQARSVPLTQERGPVPGRPLSPAARGSATSEPSRGIKRRSREPGQADKPVQRRSWPERLPAAGGPPNASRTVRRTTCSSSRMGRCTSCRWRRCCWSRAKAALPARRAAAADLRPLGGGAGLLADRPADRQRARCRC